MKFFWHVIALSKRANAKKVKLLFKKFLFKLFDSIKKQLQESYPFQKSHVFTLVSQFLPPLKNNNNLQFLQFENSGRSTINRKERHSMTFNNRITIKFKLKLCFCKQLLRAMKKSDFYDHSKTNLQTNREKPNNSKINFCTCHVANTTLTRDHCLVNVFSTF
jgi:hypothetical protein